MRQKLCLESRVVFKVNGDNSQVKLITYELWFMTNDLWLDLGGVYMIPVQVSFRYEISVYMGVILLEYHDVSCEPSFLQAILERWLSTRIRYPSQSTRPLISYRNETSYLLYMILVQNVVKSHTGTNVSYRYENRSELVPVSCKWIQSYKWEPGWTRTSIM